MRLNANPAVRVLATLAMLLFTALWATNSYALDSDFDQVEDAFDNCPGIYNPSQHNSDVGSPLPDTAGDACDFDANGDGLIDAAQGTDTDAVAPA